jgi:hippurate hydrolase
MHQWERVKNFIKIDSPDLIRFYQLLHTHPELSGSEKETASRMAEALSRAGAEITTGVGGNGVVGVIRNGPGPTVMIRAEMDALPLEEASGLPYASQAKAKGESGEDVPVMHACGHDMHSAILAGTAGLMSRMQEDWGGTLLLVAQPAEEALGGARSMLQDHLFQRFPRPNCALALHVKPELPTGKVALKPGYITLGAEALNVIIHGQGGHGATPHKAKDAVVLAAQIVLALQTIISREVNPVETAILTVGAIQGGSLPNVIPEKVSLRLMTRFSTLDVGNQIRSSVERIARGLAQAAGLPPELMPEVLDPEHPYPPVFNEPMLTERITRVFGEVLGAGNVVQIPTQIISDDFGEFGVISPPVPLVFYFIGCTDPDRFADAALGGVKIPLLHHPSFAPEPNETLNTGLLAMTAAALTLLGKK